MCGRFSVVLKDEDIRNEFNVDNPSSFFYESYNVAPSQIVPVVHLDEHQQKRLSVMEWGLLPHWAKDIKHTPRPINARLETIQTSPMFKASFQRRRCLIPASGFYEWSDKTSPKQPYYFYEKDYPIFAFAGLWNIWEREAGIVISFTIITKGAEETIKHVHGRMPFVLNKEDYDPWLYDATLPETSPNLTSHSVSLAVNSPNNNRPELIQKS
jgi:putative SOS response-associated peptidase YedK